MTCDEAFDAMTDPTRRDASGCDTALRDHLAACPRCRQMEEVLQPALASFFDAAAKNRPHGESTAGANLDAANLADATRGGKSIAHDVPASPPFWESAALLSELAGESDAAARRLLSAPAASSPPQTASREAAPFPSASTASAAPDTSPARRQAGPRRAALHRVGWVAVGLLIGFATALGLPFLAAPINPARTRPPATSICVWQRDAASRPSDDSNGAPPTARQVALTCVACHLPSGM